MSTTGKIKTLFSDKEKTEALFPRTKTSAVSAEDGTGLNAILDDINAELNTKASEAFVTNKIAEAQLSGGGNADIDLSGYATKDDLNNYYTESEVDTKLSGKAASSHNHSASDIMGITPENIGAMAQNPTSIELNSTGALSGFGGFIDFHYNGSTEDYTSRIIEEEKGVLLVSGKLKANGGKTVSVEGHTHDDRYYTADTIDAKLANISSGGSSGIVREFDSGEMNVTTYTTPGALAKIYVVELQDYYNDNYWEYDTVTIDWRMIPTTGKTYKLPEAYNTSDSTHELIVTRNSNSTVIFSIRSPGMSNYRITRVIGYY